MEVRTTKLKFKGDKKIKRKREATTADDERNVQSREDDGSATDGWANVDRLDELVGPIMIMSAATEPPSVLRVGENSTTPSFEPYRSGPISAAVPQNVGEVFLMSRLPTGVDGAVSIKSAYDKFMTCDKFGVVSCDKDAVGPAEEWIAVMRDDGIILQSYREKFLCNDDGSPRADSDAAGFREVFRLRCQAANKAKAKKKRVDAALDAEKLELENLKKFQSWGGGRRVLSKDDITELKKASKAGKLNEQMLDRREKLKADKFCK